MDGHVSHVKNLEVIDLAIDNGVVILCFPPHCTHKMQPAGVAFMKQLSDLYAEEVAIWQRAGHGVTMRNIYYLIGRAFGRAAKVETALNAFRKTGIHPFNRDIFPDSAFVRLRDESINSTSSTGT